MIQSLDFGESDKIVTFFTLEVGKLKGIAKGARRSRKRFSFLKRRIVPSPGLISVMGWIFSLRSVRTL